MRATDLAHAALSISRRAKLGNNLMWSKRTLRWSCSVAAAAALGILPALALGQEAAPTPPPPPTHEDAMNKIS